MKLNNKFKILIFIGIISVVVIRIIFYSYFKDRIDDITLSLIIVAILIILIPFEKISSFKAGNVELMLERKDVQSSISSLSLEEIDQENLKTKLKLSEQNLKYLSNSRVLWIDDYQNKILGEKRLLRTLGANIIPAISSDVAIDLLKDDCDFDLIITDIQRPGEFHKKNDGIDIHDGVNFIEHAIKNNLISKLTPIIFYAAYDYERLIKFTERTKTLRKKIVSVNNIADLFYESINSIAVLKNEKTHIYEYKIPT